MSKRKQTSLLNFFNKNKQPRVNQDDDHHHQNEAIAEHEHQLNNDVTNCASICEDQDLTQTQDDCNVNYYDVHNIVTVSCNSNPNEEEKIHYLNNFWKPTANFPFPSTSIGNEKVKRRCNYSWLLDYPWLVYSKSKNGVYCKYCCLFATECPGNSRSQSLGQFVKEPFNNWRKANDKFKDHQDTNYHKFSVLRVENLKDVLEGRRQSVIDLIDTSRAKQAQENRIKLTPIIKTILFCGRNGLPLRGHRDTDPFHFNLSEKENGMLREEGNFRQLLRFRLDSGDQILKQHLETASKNANYLSWKIQNQIVSACNHIILKKIVERANKSKCFSVLADETTDISTKEQVSICVRFIDEEDNKLHENFLQFIPVISTCAETLTNTIVTSLIDIGFDMNYLRGQGYDGAAAMSGKFTGVQAKITDKYPTALYVHCASHSLNLALSDVSDIHIIRNCLGVVQKCYTFINTPKRNAVLQLKISENCPDTKREKLKNLCPTRWVERHDSIMIMVELLNPLIQALEEIETWNDKESSSGAHILLCAIKCAHFFIPLLTIEKIFSYTLPLSRVLQSVSVDLVVCLKICEDVVTKFQEFRKSADTIFNEIFQRAEEMLKQMVDNNYDITIPRITNRQVHRCNIVSQSPEQYFRISLFLPFLDSIINQLKERFLKHKSLLESFNILIPGRNENHYKTKLELLLQKYNYDLNECNLNILTAEYELWQEKYNSASQANITKNESAMKYLQECNKEIFPNIYKLLKILVTLPVTTSTVERSFSTLKYLKNYLRNSISEERLNGLAMLYIYRNISVTEDEIFKILQQQKRKLDITL